MRVRSGKSSRPYIHHGRSTHRRRGGGQDDRCTGPHERAAEILEPFSAGAIRVYPPSRPGRYWRIRWQEAGRRRDTSACSRAEAMAKAQDLAARLARGTPTALARSTGADLVALYLDPARRPPRVERWSEHHREEQERYCRLYVLPALEAVRCRNMTRADLQRALDLAPTPSVAAHMRRCLSALVSAGLAEGHLLPDQDVLRDVRPAGAGHAPAQPADRAAAEDEIPAWQAVHALAKACAEHSGAWWRELEILLVAYSGLRWGEHAALRAERVDPGRRRINVDRQVVETRSRLMETLSKGRRRRVAMYPATTPGALDLAAMVERRLGELEPNGLLFPGPLGGWARRSNYGRSTWNPAAQAVGWPQRADGRWLWTFHSLRHVFATWALAQPGVRIEDVSRLMGHSSVHVTHDVYVHVSCDAYDRFFDATR